MPAVSPTDMSVPAVPSMSMTQSGSGPIPGGVGTPMNMPAGVPEPIPAGGAPIMMTSATSSTALSPDASVSNPSYHPLGNQNGVGMGVPSATTRRMPMADGVGNGAGEMEMGMSGNGHYGQREEGEMYNRDNIYP